MRDFTHLYSSPRSVIYKSENGFSLVEFMVAVGIGLFLVAGFTTFMVTSNSTRGELEKSSRQIENGRYAIEVLSNALRHAGYYGVYIDVPHVSGSAALPDPCATTLTNLSNGLPFPIQGYNYDRNDTGTAIPTTDPLPCLNLANYKTKTDIVVVRRVNTSAVPRLLPLEGPPLSPPACGGPGAPDARNPSKIWKVGAGGILAGEVYMQTSIQDGPTGPKTQYILDAGSNTGNFTLTQKDSTSPTYYSCADIRKFHIEIYFISPCSKPTSGTTCNGATDDGGNPIPTLKRLELVDNGSGGRVWKIVPLVEGIEDMQIDYGLDDNSDGIVDRFDNIIPDSKWPQVRSARIYLLARNIEGTPAHKDNKQYFMGIGDDPNKLPAATQDSFKRHVYSATVMIRNYR